DRARKGKTIGWNDYRIAFDVDEILLVKLFRIDNGAVDVCEELEFVRATNVVTITRRAVRDDTLAVNLFYLTRFVRLDHAVLAGHHADPFIRFDAHKVDGHFRLNRSYKSYRTYITARTCGYSPRRRLQ